MLSNHKGITLEINNKIAGKSQNRDLNSTFLNNTWAKEEIPRAIINM